MKKVEDKIFNPLVSIVIPVYNGSNYVREAIDSALAQTYKNIEIIVVNDGSIDNTDEIVKSYGSKLRYFKKENGGVSTALNLGIRESKGEYISWLSHDDVYYPDKIEKQVNFLKNMDKNTVLFGSYQCCNRNGEYQYNVNLLELHGLFNLNYEYYPLVCGCLNGCTMLVPKEIFKKIGYFNENLRTTQDYDMWSRMMINGVLFRYMDGYFLKSRIHEAQTSNKYKNYSSECDALWISILKLILKKEKNSSKDKKRKFLLLSMKLLKENNYTGAFLYCESCLKKNDSESRQKKDEKPLVSVIIPSFNQGKYLVRTIESIKKQTYKNIEIVLVDDGSTDTFTKNELFKLKGIARVYYKKNGGLSSARNYGLEKAKGEYIQFLDSDDWLDINKIRRGVSFLQKNKNYDAIYTKYKYFFEETGKYVIPKKETLNINTNKLFDEFVLRWQRPISIPVHCFLFRKYVFNEVRFNILNRVCEDWYMWINLAKNNLSLTMDDFDGCVYRVHNKSMMNFDRRGNFYKIMCAIKNIRDDLIDDFFRDTYDESMAKYVRYLADIFLPVNENILDVNQVVKKEKFVTDSEFKKKMIILFYKFDKLVPKKIRKKIKSKIVKFKFVKKFLIK